ncbi:hypothetical protein EDB19DRAFT_1717389 [Suillus lakei]|nr:hypothetical protein EDB19DRAFT_1717389 [Suillus lakei]
MHFSSVLAVVAALTVSVSAMPFVSGALIFAREVDTEAQICPSPIFCRKTSDCGSCGTCVSNLRPGFNHMTHRHGRSPFFAQASVAMVSRVSVFSASAVWLMT